MLTNISNGTILEEERPGWVATCPSCTQSFAYTELNLTPGEDVYMYCDTCSNFVLREEDRQELLRSINLNNEKEFNLTIESIYKHLQQILPSCECGGHFTLWSNVKCPHCWYKFPYNNNIQNNEIRYRESKIIWVAGSTAYRGLLLPSNKLSKVSI